MLTTARAKRGDKGAPRQDSKDASSREGPVAANHNASVGIPLAIPFSMRSERFGARGAPAEGSPPGNHLGGLTREVGAGFGEDLSRVKISSALPADDARRGVAGIAEREKLTLHPELVARSNTPGGRQLIAHEFAHVVQYRRQDPLHRSNIDPAASGRTVAHQDPEMEARSAASLVTRGEPFEIMGRGALPQRQFGFWGDVGDAAWGIGKSAVGTMQSGYEWGKEQISGGIDAAAEALKYIARIAKLGTDFRLLRMPLATAMGDVALLPKVTFRGGTWPTIVGAIALFNGAVAGMPKEVTGFAALPIVTATAAEGVEGFTVALPALLPLLEAMGLAIGAAAAALAELLLDILVVLAIIAAVLLLLYLMYQAIKIIVQAIADAIELMRPMPPIFWSMSLPPPPAAAFIRTKPPNPRVPGGQQEVVAAAIRAAGLSGLVAHHVIPLFLGGRDELAAPPNVLPWPTPMHIVGHASLQVQPQMAIWGYPISLYAHPPPGGYFLGGFKAP